MVNFNIDCDRFSSHVVTSPDMDLISAAELNLARDGRLSVQWAPFDYTPPSAKLAIVGITPGRQQANNALRAYQQALKSGLSLEAAQRHAKFVGSFSGAMRGNLVPMLDLVGLHQHFGLPSCDGLFDFGMRGDPFHVGLALSGILRRHELQRNAQSPAHTAPVPDGGDVPR